MLPINIVSDNDFPKNRNIMVHLQRLLSPKGKVSFTMYRNDSVHFLRNHVVPFTVYFQLLYSKL